MHKNNFHNFLFFFYENGFKLPVWLIVESLEEHCVEWQELEEILEQCWAVSLVNADLCWCYVDGSDMRDSLVWHGVEM